MATVKLQNGNVILKDGKVSCSCCPTPEPQECCMYPAQALYDGDYSVDDLPDAIVATNSRGSHVLTKDGYGGGVSGFEPIISGAIYGNNDPAEDETVVTLQESDEGVAWVYGSGLGGGENPCLITEIEPIIGGVEDQFADTYTVTWQAINSPYSATVTRTSLCVWEGVDPCGQSIYLYYGDNIELGGGNDLCWNLKLKNYVSGCDTPDFLGYIITKDQDPPSYQNTPTGYYPQTFATDATVS